MAAVTICSDIVKANWFLSAVMYGCEIWTIKKAEHWRIDVFKLWCYRRFLKVSWITRRSNQSFLKEINPKYALERLVLKLKPPLGTWWESWLVEKDLDSGKDSGQEGKCVIDDKMVGWHHWLSGHELSKFRKSVKDREFWHAALHGFTKNILLGYTSIQVLCLLKKSRYDWRNIVHIGDTHCWSILY